MRTLAIGDIHGCLTALTTVLCAADVTPKDSLVFLGDYIDRGFESRAVVDHLINLSAERRAVCLRGNHEEVVLEARSDVLKSRLWLTYGGDQTLQSYGADYREDWQDFIPPAHWRFFEDTRMWLETEAHVFVHASVAPDLDMADQPESVLLWERHTDRIRHKSGKMVVCGHTPQRSGAPSRTADSVCIDTGACHGGWLTCLDVDSTEYWQAREDGSTRQARL